MRNRGSLSPGSGDDIFVSNEEKEDDGFEFPRRNVRFSSPEEAPRGVPRFQRVDSIAVNKARMMRNRGGLSPGSGDDFFVSNEKEDDGFEFPSRNVRFSSPEEAPRGVPDSARGLYRCEQGDDDAQSGWFEREWR